MLTLARAQIAGLREAVRARTNSIKTGKQPGYIVDYISLADRLTEAVMPYAVQEQDFCIGTHGCGCCCAVRGSQGPGIAE